MQVLSSLRSAKNRHPDCKIVRRRGRVYVICKSNPRFKAVQGGTHKNADVKFVIRYQSVVITLGQPNNHQSNNHSSVPKRPFVH